MHLDCPGLVLAAKDTAENDRLLTILTADVGVVTAFANGARRRNSRLQAAVQALCYGDFSLYRRRDTYTVDDARAQNVFFGLRADLTRLALAQYFCALATVLAPAEHGGADFLQLLLLALTCLDKQRHAPVLIKPAVELRLLSLAGWTPDLSRCRVCGADTLAGDFVTLDLHEGNFICADEPPQAGERIGLGVLSAMRHICDAPLRRLFAFTLPAPSLARLGEVCEALVRVHIPERTRAVWDTLAFYQELC
ncbi:MAG: DNA repair protein RecO [Oscillospiraceae bacterium]|jgi:DNA repair protein RecO (recombination protein O)|nr:DNA repair protein RecO [Oscillospiraceae bacterium]